MPVDFICSNDPEPYQVPRKVSTCVRGSPIPGSDVRMIEPRMPGGNRVVHDEGIPSARGDPQNRRYTPGFCTRLSTYIYGD